MFELKEKNGIKYFTSDLIEIHHACTTKGLDMKSDIDRDVFCNKFGFENLVIPIQEHTDNIALIDSKDDLSNDLSATDGVIVSLKGVSAMVVCADCVPVLLYSKEKNVMALLHAGWKGTAKGIVSKAVHILKKRYGVEPCEIKGLIGAAIGQCCYEISDDVAQKLVNSLSKNYNDIIKDNMASLSKINYYQMIESGMVDIDVMDYCTSCDNDLFYSYRKNEKTPKRHSVIASL